MSEIVLRILLQLFAITAKIDEVTDEEREVVREFLKDHLSPEDVDTYLRKFDEFARKYSLSDFDKLCEDVSSELTIKQKYIVLLRLLVLIRADGVIDPAELDLSRKLANAFRIRNDQFERIRSFVETSDPSSIDHEDLLFIDTSDQVYQHAKRIGHHHITGRIAILRIPEAHLFFLRYAGTESIRLNAQFLNPKNVFVLNAGSVIHPEQGNTIYFSDILGRFVDYKQDHEITVKASAIEFEFPGGKKGLRGVSLNEKSGNLVAIMGASGSGKSTMLNVLNGNYTPSAGSVTFNGIDLHQHLEDFKGYIGYVPQDDLLIEELSVYQNLFFNAKLCFKDKSDEELDALVKEVLEDLGLLEIKDLKVGSPLNKKISGGQRKRLNIGLELLRKPEVIYFDEPTSGLSSRDSENIMDLLKELTLKGKLIFVVIHQPSSDIYKLFDKLLILDTGGYQIWYGNPIEAVVWFKRMVGHVDADRTSCPDCGNINPEQIFDIIETRIIDEYGNETPRRRIPPAQWGEWYQEDRAPKIAAATGAEKQADKPVRARIKTPGWLQQFSVYLKRDMLSKLGNRQYLIINSLEAPLLAVILAVLVRFYAVGTNGDGSYFFGRNDNIPAYFFMSIVVALFVGLTMSAEEIIRDRKILKRESFLSLKRSSYLTAKISILFAITAIQMATFILIGNFILEVPGLHLEYWLILFSLGCFAVMLGLNISQSFNSAVTIYILIPLLLIPQLILSGTIVKFDKLNPYLTSIRKVPMAAEVMASRWAYEALTVLYFKDNEYQKAIFPYDMQKSEAMFAKDFWVPEMVKDIDYCINNMHSDVDSVREEIGRKLAVIRTEVEKENMILPQLTFDASKLADASLNEQVTNDFKAYLEDVKRHFIRQQGDALKNRDQAIYALQAQFPGKNDFVQFRLANHNEAVEKLVRNEDNADKIAEKNGELVQVMDPVFNRPKFPDHYLDFRTHFYAPAKHFAGMEIDTFIFNVMILWVMTAILYVMLYFRVLQRIVQFRR